MTKTQLVKMTIPQIETLLACGEFPTEARLCALLARDRRAGVRRLAVRERRRLRDRESETARLGRLREHERRLWEAGWARVAGVDEVGRGCLAGPVVAAAVVLPHDAAIEGLDDSKKLDRELRERIGKAVLAAAEAYAIGVVDAPDIDRLNVLEATMEAMRRALAGLPPPDPDQVLVDGSRKPGSRYPETTLVDGDERSMSIAAASIVAKVHRDRLMLQYDAEHPQYGFASNKGYGSAQHLEALTEHGPCPLHRRSFRPVAIEEGIEADGSLSLFGSGNPADLGRRGEAAAAEYLERKDYRILERRFRIAGAEIDLIARSNDGCVVFVEVKTSGKKNSCRPEARVGLDKQTHLNRAAAYYLQRHESHLLECRFDVIAVVLTRGSETPAEITHYENAFGVRPL